MSVIEEEVKEIDLRLIKDATAAKKE